MSPFDDDLIVNRLFDKLDNIDGKIDDLCTRVTTIEVTSATINAIAQSKVERKEKVFYVVLGLIGAIVSIIEVTRLGIIG